MKVYYFNDEQRRIAIFTGTMEDRPTILEKAEGKQFDIDAPPNTIPFIKRWPGYVLISWMNDLGGEDE